MNKQPIKTIDVLELKNQMDIHPALCLIDVREVFEWQMRRIPGALHIPKDEISSKIALHNPDKNHPVFLHCQSGVRSLYAAQSLMDIGYTEVYSVNGGIMDWVKFGYPVEE